MWYLAAAEVRVPHDARDWSYVATHELIAKAARMYEEGAGDVKRDLVHAGESSDDFELAAVSTNRAACACKPCLKRWGLTRRRALATAAVNSRAVRAGVRGSVRGR